MPINPPTLADLAAETPESEIKQRPVFEKRDGRTVRSSKTLSYIDARYVMQRLDDVLGPENWRDDYVDLTGGAVRCTIHVFLNHSNPGGEGVIEVTPGWVGKSDVGVPSSIEPQKGAYSDAFKRAAVKWGIGRDLYEDRENDEPPPDTRPIRQRTEDDDPLPYGDDEPSRSSSHGTRGSSRSGRSSTTSSRNGGGTSSGGGNRSLAAKEREYDTFMESWDPEDSPWYCPDHDSVEVKEPFMNPKSGNAVGASLGCRKPYKECGNRGPWVADLLRARDDDDRG